jgi:hypothetical protein
LLLLLQAFAAWKQHHEDLQYNKAAAHNARRHTGRAMVAWKLGLALIHRKRSLIAASKHLAARHRQQHSLAAWMRYTYYKHMGHVGLHFRVRRLACVVMREWQEVSLTAQTTTMVTFCCEPCVAIALKAFWRLPVGTLMSAA